MPRPRGEIRAAIAQAAARLAPLVDGEACAGATWRELAEAAQVGYDLARSTAKNMADAGELQRVGRAKDAHSTNWMTLYAPAPPAPAGRCALADVMQRLPAAVA